MPNLDLVVIGGSAGAIEALEQLVTRLSGDLQAAVFVVTHLSPRAKSWLPEILKRKSALPVREAQDGERVENGNLYVAPPDRHLLIANGHVHLTRGPKEGLQRPSINVTFRSAATTYGPRVIGVLLSGMLDDGAAGLWEIAQHGGVAIVQDPDEAKFPSMPVSALLDVSVHYRLEARRIGIVVSELVSGERPAPKMPTTNGNKEGGEHFSGFTCPECRGPLYKLDKPGPPEFKCRVGHVLSLGALINEATSTQERKLYEAIVALQEGADIAEYASRQSDQTERGKLRAEAQQLREHAAAIKRMLETRAMPSFG
jgi:two-component system chemotaxis response regulator CheB